MITRSSWEERDGRRKFHFQFYEAPRSFSLRAIRSRNKGIRNFLVITFLMIFNRCWKLRGVNEVVGKVLSWTLLLCIKNLGKC